MVVCLEIGVLPAGVKFLMQAFPEITKANVRTFFKSLFLGVRCQPSYRVLGKESANIDKSLVRHELILMILWSIVDMCDFRAALFNF